MQTHDQIIAEEGPKPPRQGLWLGIAAAAAIVIGALLLLPLGNEAPVADQPPTSPVEIATAFVEAFARFDVGEAASYLAADANLDGMYGGESEWQQNNAWREAIGLKVLVDACVVREETASGTSVRCAYDYHNLRSDEMGMNPYRGSRFDITVLDGEIVSVVDEMTFMTNDFSALVWEPFGRWVAETYPDDVAVMYTYPSQGEARYTEESIALWEQRTREYVEVVGG